MLRISARAWAVEENICVVVALRMQRRLWEEVRLFLTLPVLRA
jgi:hypothetical protein